MKKYTPTPRPSKRLVWHILSKGGSGWPNWVLREMFFGNPDAYVGKWLPKFGD